MTFFEVVSIFDGRLMNKSMSLQGGGGTIAYYELIDGGRVGINFVRGKDEHGQLTCNTVQSMFYETKENGKQFDLLRIVNEEEADLWTSYRE